MPSKPVTVDLLHPTVVRAFTNWGYISFFGAMAALITLLFFAIGQVKQADEARQVNRDREGRQAQNAEELQAFTPEGATDWRRVEPPYTYESSEAGFEIDYTPLVKTNDIVSRSFLNVDGYNGVYFGSEANIGSGPFFTVRWKPDQQTIDQFEVDFRSEVKNAFNGFIESSIERRLVGGVQALWYLNPGECGGGTYVFFRNGYRISFGNICENWKDFPAALRSLKFR